jgi:Flp pilus assembly protein TadB
MTLFALLAGGCLLGLGCYLLVQQLLPSQPHLSSAMDRLHVSPLSATQALSPAREAARAAQRTSREAASAETRDRIGRRVAFVVRNVPLLQPPEKDLKLIGTTTNEWFGEKTIWALLGLLVPGVAYICSSLPALVLSTEPLLPLQLPVLAAPLCAMAAWFVPDLQLRSRVTKAREEFSRAIAAYLEYVALERRAGIGPAQALENAAAVAQSWPFRRLREQLLRCAWSGVRPWDGLHELSREVGVPELAELAETMRLSSDEGANIYAALRARATSLRNAQVAADQTEANAGTERIKGPIALLAMVFAVFLITPMMLQLM